MTLLYEYDRPQVNQPPILVQVWHDFPTRRIVVTFDYIQVSGGPADGPKEGDELPYYFCTGTNITQFYGLAAFPYARAFTPNPDDVAPNPLCAAGRHRLRVAEIKTTNAEHAGSFSGTATIILTGARATPPTPISTPTHILRYSIDNGVTWQESNVFEKLPIGKKTVFVQEEKIGAPAAEWHTVKANFVIDFNKTYSSRFYNNFDDDLPVPIRNGWRLNILEQNGFYAVSKVCNSGKPVTIQISDNPDKYAHIRASSCTVELEATRRFQYWGFYAGDERKFRVDIERNGQLYWRGYILPDQYNEPFVSPTYHVQAIAADGLATLNKYPYLDKNQNSYSGIRSLLDVIFDCLDKLDLSIGLQTAVDLYEKAMYETPDTTSTNQNFSDPLFQTKINVALFYLDGKTADCATVLNYCLSVFDARIYQCEGKFRIEAIDAKRRGYFAANWRANRTFGGYEIINRFLEPQRPNQNEGDLIWVTGNQNYNVQPAHKNTVFEADYQVITNVIPGGNLTDADFDENNQLLKWFGAAKYERINDPEKNKNSIRIGFTSGTTAETKEYLQSEPFYLEKGDQLQINIEGILSGSGAISFEVDVFGPELQLGGVIWKTLGEASLSAPFVVNINSKASAQVVTGPAPKAGNYFVRINEPYINLAGSGSGGFVLDRFAAQVLANGRYPLSSATASVESPFSFTYSPAPEKLFFVDTPLLKNHPAIYLNSLLVSGSQAEEWHIKGDRANSGKLINILAANRAYNHARPSFVVKGVLRGIYTYQDVIRETDLQGRLFIANGWSYDVKAGLHDVTLHELLIPVPDPEDELTSICGILLETGEGFVMTEDFRPIELESC